MWWVEAESTCIRLCGRGCQEVQQDVGPGREMGMLQTVVGLRFDCRGDPDASDCTVGTRDGMRMVRCAGPRGGGR
eukprot:2192603-Prymnesium_polylepis.1